MPSCRRSSGGGTAHGRARGAGLWLRHGSLCRARPVSSPAAGRESANTSFPREKMGSVPSGGACCQPCPGRHGCPEPRASQRGTHRKRCPPAAVRRVKAFPCGKARVRMEPASPRAARRLPLPSSSLPAGRGAARPVRSPRKAPCRRGPGRGRLAVGLPPGLCPGLPPGLPPELPPRLRRAARHFSDTARSIASTPSASSRPVPAGAAEAGEGGKG